MDSILRAWEGKRQPKKKHVLDRVIARRSQNETIKHRGTIWRHDLGMGPAWPVGRVDIMSGHGPTRDLHRMLAGCWCVGVHDVKRGGWLDNCLSEWVLQWGSSGEARFAAWSKLPFAACGCRPASTSIPLLLLPSSKKKRKNSKFPQSRLLSAPLGSPPLFDEN